jgi:ribonuclease R
MRDRLGDVAEGSVTALVGSGAFVTLDEPFVDVLVRFEAMGPDRYELSENELSVVGARSGDTIGLGDRMLVTIDDVAVLRRTVYAARVVPEALLEQAASAQGGSKRRAERGNERGNRNASASASQPGSRGRPQGGAAAKGRPGPGRARRDDRGGRRK